jgi:hypothetical protein
VARRAVDCSRGGVDVKVDEQPYGAACDRQTLSKRTKESTCPELPQIAQARQSVDRCEVVERCVEELRNGLAPVLLEY